MKNGSLLWESRGISKTKHLDPLFILILMTNLELKSRFQFGAVGVKKDAS